MRLATMTGMRTIGSDSPVQGPPSLRVLEPLAVRSVNRGDRHVHSARTRTMPPRVGRLRLAPRLTIVGGRRDSRYWPVVAGRIGVAMADHDRGPDAPLIA
jgi:hypothetical protein